MPDPSTNITNAISAYNSAAKGKPLGEERAAPAAGGDEFESLVRGAIDEAIKIGQRGEQMSIAGINDRADLTQVVTAVAEAEVTLQTVVTVRDKVLEAYKEILRMPM